MSTLMTERRRPLDNDDGQASLFGADAFAAKTRAPAPWEHAGREVAARPDHAHVAAHTAPAHLRPAFEASVPPTVESTPVPFESGVQAPLDEAQALTEHAHGPSAEELAAYRFEVGTAPTDVPAHDAGEELAALERATVAPVGAWKPRAPLAGPTLDDIMSRAWEGLVTGLPAACPVCRGEVVPSFAGALHGSCSSCGTRIE